MPLSKIQFDILRLLASHRDPESYVALSAGVQYYTSTLSFDQRSIRRLAVHLVFVRDHPDWVRVYECDPHGQHNLISDLRPFREDEEISWSTSTLLKMWLENPPASTFSMLLRPDTRPIV